jgi:hypothetical protein
MLSPVGALDLCARHGRGGRNCHGRALLQRSRGEPPTSCSSGSERRRWSEPRVSLQSPVALRSSASLNAAGSCRIRGPGAGFGANYRAIMGRPGSDARHKS